MDSSGAPQLMNQIVYTAAQILAALKNSMICLKGGGGGFVYKDTHF